MDTNSQRQKRWDGVFSLSNVAIEAVNLAKVSRITPAQAVFDSVSILLAVVGVNFLLFSDACALGSHIARPGLYGEQN